MTKFDWHLNRVLQFIFLILAFGICAHFYCAAALLKKTRIKQWAFRACCLVILIVLFMYPEHLGLGQDTSINFTPHAYNALMAGMLLLWAAALRILTELKRKIGG